MDALTLDLIGTVLASLGLVACAAAAIWVLPWRKEDWVPRPVPLKRGSLPPTPLLQAGVLEESAGR